jgi:hypothetical protein
MENVKYCSAKEAVYQWPDLVESSTDFGQRWGHLIQLHCEVICGENRCDHADWILKYS